MLNVFVGTSTNKTLPLFLSLKIATTSYAWRWAEKKVEQKTQGKNTGRQCENETIFSPERIRTAWMRVQKFPPSFFYFYHCLNLKAGEKYDGNENNLASRQQLFHISYHTSTGSFFCMACRGDGCVWVFYIRLCVLKLHKMWPTKVPFTGFHWNIYMCVVYYIAWW